MAFWKSVSWRRSLLLAVPALPRPSAELIWEWVFTEIMWSIKGVLYGFLLTVCNMFTSIITCTGNLIRAHRLFSQRFFLTKNNFVILLTIDGHALGDQSHPRSEWMWCMGYVQIKVSTDCVRMTRGLISVTSRNL